MIIQNKSTVLLSGKCFMIGIENKLFGVEDVRLIIFWNSNNVFDQKESACAPKDQEEYQ